MKQAFSDYDRPLQRLILFKLETNLDIYFCPKYYDL